MCESAPYVMCHSIFFSIWADKAWIDAVNEERGMGGADRISYETFEIMMDRLEKDWFDLVCCCLCS